MEVSNTDIFLFCVFVILMFILCILGIFLNVIIPFMEARAYIKDEINRSEGEEYYHWKRELKKLYIEHIPIFGWLIRKFRR